MNSEREKIRREIFGKPEGGVQEQPNNPDIDLSSEVSPELVRLFPPERIKRLMEKEARKYKQALEKKWANWFRSVSK